MKNIFFRNDLQGIECPGVVIISSSINGTHSMKLISRCISNLVLVTKESELGDLKKDHDTFHIIHVQGNTTRLFCCFSLLSTLKTRRGMIINLVDVKATFLFYF